MSALRGELAEEPRSSRAMEDFVADAAHQLSTPLARIRGELDLVLGRNGALDGETRAHLEAIRAELEAHLHTCARLLLLAQLDGGALDDVLRTDEVDLHVVLGELIEQLTPLARERALSLRLRAVAGAAAPSVRCCRALLVEALLNLLDNALRYTPRGGCIEVVVRAGTRQVAVSVVDTGPGVAAAERELVFRRFYRGRAATEAGTGLGLAIARSIARAHGGDVLLCSSAGRGATFEVRLPVG